MTPRRLLSVAGLAVRREPRGFILSAGGIAVGIAAFIYFVGLGLGVSLVVREQIFPVEVSHVKVIPQRFALGAFLGGGVLDAQAVERLKAIPGVVDAYRKVDLAVPAVSQYNGDFFGRSLRMGVDILAVGVDEAYVLEHLPPGTRFGDQSEVASSAEPTVEAVVPAVLSTRLLQLYNTTFAPARGLPRLSERQLIGFRFPLTLGASYVTRGGGARRTVLLEVVGFSDRAMLLGVTVPLEAVQQWNASMRTEEGSKESFSALVLVAESPDRVKDIIVAVRSAGFDVDQTEKMLAEEIGAAVLVTTLALSLLSMLILGLAALSIARSAHARVVSRTREIGVMRAVGARRLDVAAMVLAESVAAGAIGGLVGLLLGSVGTMATDLLVARYVGDFPFKPESFFVFPLWLPAIAVVAALAAAGLGAVLPATKAAGLDPVVALSGGS